MGEGKSKRPTVAIVGRPNVGKSALFNRLVGRRISIVHDQPGVTRDRIVAPCRRGPVPFELVDTGGIGLPLEDGFGEQVRAEAEIAVASADLILWVVDAQEGLTGLDEELGAYLRKSGVPVLLVANKVDVDKHENLVTDFAGLGFGNPLPVSAEHGRQVDGLLERVGQRLAQEFAAEQTGGGEEDGDADRLCVAVVGQPNVGKSSLINAILEDERTIVSEVAGTTRDAVDVPYERDGRHYTLIDTAGMRRKTKRDSAVEVFSVMRSERSIRRSSLCLLVVDVARGITAMDRTIAGIIVEAQKPCIVVANKFDLFHPEGARKERLEEMRDIIRRELFFLNYAPAVAVSAKKGQHLPQIFSAVDKVVRAASEPIGTGVLNRFLRECVERNPAPVVKNRHLNLLYATLQRPDSPRMLEAPRFLLFVNHADLVSRTYERYLENALRERFDLNGMPVRFEIRSRQSKRSGKEGSWGSPKGTGSRVAFREEDFPGD